MYVWCFGTLLYINEKKTLLYREGVFFVPGGLPGASRELPGAPGSNPEAIRHKEILMFSNNLDIWGNRPAGLSRMAGGVSHERPAPRTRDILLGCGTPPYDPGEAPAIRDKL